MRRLVMIVQILVGVVVAGVLTFAIFLYFTNRTIDQTLALNFAISNDWTEINADPPLTEFRKVAELAIAIPGYHHNPSERVEGGQVRLPDGRISTLEIEGIDQTGNRVSFRHGGFTMSTRDLVIFRQAEDLDGQTSITKIRIRSDLPFNCEELFWRNRNPK